MQTPPRDPNAPYAPTGAPQTPAVPYYPPQQGAFPVQPQVGPGMPPPFSPAPQQPVEPPAYPPQQDAFSSPQGAFPPQQNTFPSQHGAFPPQQNTFQPQQNNYPPQQGAFQPQQGAFQPQQGAFQPQQGAFQPQQNNVPPQQTPNEYQQKAYQPQQPAPFQQQQPFRAPRMPNYRRINLILGLVVGALMAVLAVVAVMQLTGPAATRTALVSAGRLGANYTGDAVVVRNEALYTQNGISQVDYLVNEGAHVSRGNHVCTVYTSGFSTREWTTLNNYRAQIKQYQKSLLAQINIESDAQLKRLNDAVLTRARETQAMVQLGLGNLLNQEALMSSDIEERAYYLKQKYADDQRLSRLYDDEQTQLQRIETWTTPFVAGDVGIVSFYTDGYERGLNNLTYDTFSPNDVRAMYEGKLPESAALARNEAPVYRLIRETGYTVLMLCDDASWTPTVGASYGLLVESFDNTMASATVESLTRAEGELLLRLRVNADVTPVLYIRSCHVQLSESIYSLTVPVDAITDDGGELGVVVVQSDGNYFLPVTVISQDAHEAHIVPLLDNILSVGSTVLLF